MKSTWCLYRRPHTMRFACLFFLHVSIKHIYPHINQTFSSNFVRCVQLHNKKVPLRTSVLIVWGVPLSCLGVPPRFPPRVPLERPGTRYQGTPDTRSSSLSPEIQWANRLEIWRGCKLEKIKTTGILHENSIICAKVSQYHLHPK